MGGSMLAPPYDYLLKAIPVVAMGAVGLSDSPGAVLYRPQRLFIATLSMIAVSSLH